MLGRPSSGVCEPTRFVVSSKNPVLRDLEGRNLTPEFCEEHLVMILIHKDPHALNVRTRPLRLSPLAAPPLAASRISRRPRPTRCR